MEVVSAIAQIVPLVNGGGEITGASGWVGTGLLGAVLSWLLFVHLPAKDKQVKEMTDAHTERLDQLGSHHVEAIEKVISAHERQLERILEHCKSEISAIVNDYREAKGKG